MQALRNHKVIIESYKNFLTSFFNIADERIALEVKKKFEDRSSTDSYLPEPLIQFNPAYKTGIALENIRGTHATLKNILGKYNLYHHQVEAILQGIAGNDFVVTSGTGSGKSLTFLATIFNDILNNPDKGIRAIIVYPMNALINSQEEEIKKYEINYLKSCLPGSRLYTKNTGSLDQQLDELRELTGEKFPITYAKYTGQESAATKEDIRENPPHILLTNYMMLELIMTRHEEKKLRETIAQHLKFLAFDELHTYRGRQGADVSMLIRRIKNLRNDKVICIGTSATMSSEGTAEEKKKAIAEVATRIFDEQYLTSQIIGEKLEAVTDFSGEIPEASQLSKAIKDWNLLSENAEAFKSHPLAIWLEIQIALRKNENDEFERGIPKTLPQIVQQLSDDSRTSEADCEKAIHYLLEWIEQLNITGAQETPRKSYLPFKIHQFISQTGTVQVTLDSRAGRHITLDDERYWKIPGKADVLLYPVLFSRYSGTDFICVKLEHGKIMPRDPDNTDDLPEKITQADIKADKATGKLKRTLGIEDFPHGYLILQEEGDDAIWEEDDKSYLPDSWFAKNGQIKNFYEHRLPRLIHFNSEGNYSWTKEGKFPLKAWYMPAYLLFDPTSGIIFDLKTGENTKLSRLGNEGRSSATTILGAGILKTLQQNGIPVNNQKFLSFTDNRQDASLQAGHFNDFFTISRLRAAIYKAVKNNPDGLDCNRIGIEVFKELGLHEKEYALYPSSNPLWPDEGNIKAIQKYIIIRILYDLKLEWRYTTPNLEQTALVKIGYYKLNEFCKMDGLFSSVAWLKQMQPEDREQTLTQILNYFRTSFAFEHIYLVEKREEVDTELKSKLDEKKLWSLNFNEKIEIPYVLLPQSKGKTKTKEYTASIGARSYLGKYIKRLVKEKAGIVLKEGDVTSEIAALCKLLVDGHYLNQVPVKVAGTTLDGYRIRIDQIIWKAGDEQNTLRDEVRFIKYKATATKPNAYFLDFYKQDFKTYEREGKEHTGQLNNEDRIHREDAFRKGELSALFCSPTMELGIDISQLNIVHMRNVPPRPDNYAQRSGRAGRSGQSALVYTFCSQKSPHDRNYFKSPASMVNGSVIAPKLDLTNEELLKSHLYAFIMMELEIDVKLSVSEIIDIEHPTLPIYEKIKVNTEDHLKRFAVRWAQQFHRIISKMEGIHQTSWHSENWLSEQINTFYKNFDEAFERWRILYRNAKKTLDDAHVIISTPNHPRIADARRTQAVALRQRDLLLNKNKASAGSESEFYIFRYLASEGFLPGYNFTRLPVRTFVGHKASDKGEYISRPRFIALKEFGPQNLIYHNGSKYKVVKMQLSLNGELLETIKVSKQTGYAFRGQEAEHANNDPITNTELKGDNVLKIPNILALSESEARMEERISCNEEYRTSQGYVIDQYFTFSKGIAYTQHAKIKAAEHDLLQVIYDQSATLVQINNKWKITRNEDFAIGKTSGRWKTRAEEQEQIGNTDDPIIKAKVYTTATADILYIQPVKELQLTEDGVCTLAFALKQAIENTYQVEENEIGVWIMGKMESKNILIYESAEGSLGVLKDLLNDTRQLRAIFVEAYKLLGFDPITKTDIRPDTPKASYDDLLSYNNQLYHEKLDRFSVKEALEKLLQCNIDNQKGNRSLEEQYKHLLSTYDLNSSTEKPLIEYLYRNGHILPDKAQFNIPNLYVSADFVYKLSDNRYALIFCDGSVHDHHDIKADDNTKRQNCRDAGYEVIEWHYSEPIDIFVKRNQHIFRKTR